MTTYLTCQPTVTEIVFPYMTVNCRFPGSGKSAGLIYMISVILLLLYKYYKILKMYGAQKVGKQGRDIDDGIKQFSIQPPYS